jgi:hypothetical protein
MSVFFCTFTGFQNGPVTDEQLQGAHALVRKRYPPCYRDNSVTIFSCNDYLPVVAQFVKSVCDQVNVGGIAIPIERDNLWAYGVQIAKCFEGSQSFRNVDRPLMSG